MVQSFIYQYCQGISINSNIENYNYTNKWFNILIKVCHRRIVFPTLPAIKVALRFHITMICVWGYSIVAISMSIIAFPKPVWVFFCKAKKQNVMSIPEAFFSLYVPTPSPANSSRGPIMWTIETIDKFYLFWILSKYILDTCLHALLLCSALFFSFFFLLLFFFFTYNVSTASTFASTSTSLMKMLCPKSPMATLLTNPEAIYLSVIYSLLLNSVKEIAGQQFLKFYDSVVLWFTSYLSKCCFMFACFVFKLLN